MYESFHYELHVCICFSFEAETQEDVDREAGVADPGVAIVPVSHATDGFGDGEGWGSYDGSSGFCRGSARFVNVKKSPKAYRKSSS